MDRILSGATTPGQSGPGSDDNEGVLHIPKKCGITEATPSDCIMSYPGHSLGWRSYPCRVFYSPGRLGKMDRYIDKPVQASE